MIVGTQTRRLLHLPGFAWRTLWVRAAKSVKPLAEKKEHRSALSTFEQMMTHQVNLAFRDEN